MSPRHMPTSVHKSWNSSSVDDSNSHCGSEFDNRHKSRSSPTDPREPNRVRVRVRESRLVKQGKMSRTIVRCIRACNRARILCVVTRCMFAHHLMNLAQLEQTTEAAAQNPIWELEPNRGARVQVRVRVQILHPSYPPRPLPPYPLPPRPLLPRPL
jgi:hypothetical protein